MKVLNNFDEALIYVNKLGIVNRSMPICWKQQDLCNIIKSMEEIATIPYTPGIYPFKVRYLRKRSKGRSIYFMIENCYRSVIQKIPFPK